MSRARRLASLIADTVISKTESFTVASADWGKRHDCAHASTAIHITLPNDTNDPGVPLNEAMEFARTGAGVVDFVADSGVTINYDAGAGLKIAARWESAIVRRTGANTYRVQGYISA